MTTFINATGITIVDESIESQTLDVSGLTGNVSNVSVTLSGLSHTYGADLDFLLVGPNGVANLVFWSDAGSSHTLSSFDVTVSDTGALRIPVTSTIMSGRTYRPADYFETEDGSNWGIALSPINHPTTNGSATFGSVFGATAANGTWTLYVRDDAGIDEGSLASWSLHINENIAPVIANPDAVIAAAGTGPVNIGITAPSDPENDPLTVTLTTLPGYGTLQFFNGASFVDVTTPGTHLTTAQLTSLRYLPPTSGEHGGETLVYTVSDGLNPAVTGTVEFTVEVDSAGPANLYFSAFGGPGNGGNVDLYTLGSSGNPLAIPLNSPNGSFAGEDGGFFQFAGRLYFNAVTPGGDALYAMDSGGNVTVVADKSNAGQPFQHINQVDSSFIEFAGRLYFKAGQLGEVNADGTSQLINLNGASQAFTDNQYGGFVEFDHSLYFSAFNDRFDVSTFNARFVIGGSSAPDLIKLDADGTVTAISTREPGNESSGSFAGEDGGFAVFNNALYFNAYSDTLGSDALFRLDAGSTAPELVDPGGEEALHLFPGISSAFHTFNDSLYFIEYSFSVGDYTLYRLDADDTLTPLSIGGDPLVAAGEFGGMVDFAGSMFFVADLAGVTSLMRLDSCGCIDVVYDNGGNGAFDANLVSGFVQFNGSLYFDAYTSGGDALFRLDANGLLTEVDLGGGSTTLAGVNGGFKVLGDGLYFSANTADGSELVRLDTDGTAHVYDINPGAANDSFDPFLPTTNPDFGLFPFTVLHGTGGPDVLAGGDRNEIIDAGADADVIEGRGGNDIITGDGGPDTIKFDASGPANVDRIMDYSLAGGDVIDLSALLDANFTPTSNVMDFVRLAGDGQNLRLQVDADGPANGPTWTDVAILDGANTFFSDEATVRFAGADHTLVELDLINVRTVTLANGGWAVTWSQSGDDDGTQDLNLYGRVFDAAGQQLGGTFEISDPNDMPDENALITAFANGNFAVTWQNCDDDILTRVYDSSGHEISAGTQTVASTSGEFPTLAQTVALSNGGYAVYWQQEDFFADGENVYVATVDADGTLSTGPTIVNGPGAHADSLTSDLESLPLNELDQLVALDHGFAVVWRSGRDTGPGGANEDSIFVRVFDNAGNPLTGEIQANSIDAGLTSVDGGTLTFPSDIVHLTGDNFALVWESDASSGTQQLFTRVFNSADYTASAPVRVDANSDPNIGAQRWHTTALKNGGYATIFDQFDFPNSPDSDVFIQTFDASGAIASGSQPGGIKVNQVSGAGHLSDQVLALAGGGFVAMFDATRDDGVGVGVDEDVYIRTFGANGAPTSSEIIVNTPDAVADFGAQMFALADGGFLVLWNRENADGSHEDMLVKHFDAAGTQVGSEVLVASTPFELGNADFASNVDEFRASLSANQTLLVAMIDEVSYDGWFNAFYPLDLHFVPGSVFNPPVNAAPVNILPATLDIDANTSTAIGGLSIVDPDAASGSLTTTLAVVHGTLTVASAGGAAVTGSGTGTVTLNGTLTQINTTLAAANNVVYLGAHDDFGTDSFTMVTNDNGNTGGGPLTDTDQVTIHLNTHLIGTPGPDSFTALPGNERIDALTGVDTITFGFRLVDATVTYVGNQVIIDGPSSHTVLTGFEVFTFTDGTVNNNDADPLVDDLFYYSRYHDVWTAHVDADQHYHQYGWHEGRDPDAFFSTAVYLSANPDVRAAGVDPLIHFDQYGWKEGRVPSITFDPAAYLAANPDVKAAHADPLEHFLSHGAQEGRQPIAPTELLTANGFDYVYYLQHNPDVAAAHVDPFQHFETTGWKEGRNPNALFDTNGYLATYADVKAANINPLDHYNVSGWHEGRDPSVGFDTTSYLAAYPDVAAAHINPLVHFLDNGIHEGRSPFADGVWG